MKISRVNSKLCSWSNYLIIIAQISWNSLEASGSVCCCREDPALDEVLGYFRLAVSRVCLAAGYLDVGRGFGCNCNALLFAEAQPPLGGVNLSLLVHRKMPEGKNSSGAIKFVPTECHGRALAFKFSCIWLCSIDGHSRMRS